VGMLQVNRMLIFTGDQGRHAIEETYPAMEAISSAPDPSAFKGLPVNQTLVHSGPPLVIQAVHVADLTRLAVEADAVIEMASAIGDTVIEMTPILRVRGNGRRVDEQALADAVELGDERTFEQDPKYAIRLLVDIAIKALSPAINDPTTAVQALDQIEDLLLRLGRHRLDLGAFHDDNGSLRLIVPLPDWEDFLRISLDEIGFCGAESVQVMRRMNALLTNLIAVLPEARHGALRLWEKRIESSIARSFPDVRDKEDASVGDRQGLGIGSEDPDSP